MAHTASSWQQQETHDGPLPHAVRHDFQLLFSFLRAKLINLCNLGVLEAAPGTTPSRTPVAADLFGKFPKADDLINIWIRLDSYKKG